MIRSAEKTDIYQLMPIFEAAQAELKSQGINQWQNGYPNREIIAQDIDNKECYVSAKNGEILASAVISFREEPTYTVIRDGRWLTDGERYAVIHRIVSSPGAKRSGEAEALLKYAEELCKKEKAASIRIDTHKDNLIMQHWLKKHQFIYCGVIQLTDGDLRIAFEKQDF